MSIIINEAKKEIARLESMKRIVDEFQEDEPRGCLKCQKRGEYVYFYQQQRNEQSKQSERRFIKKENIALVKSLAQKQYYSLLKPIIERNLKILRLLIKQYSPEQIDTVYEKLSVERKKLILPIQDSKEERIRNWYEEEYEKNNSYPENLRYKTEQGELVRSKSEVIIANILYQHRDVLLYKYESPLKVIVAGKEMTIYPDFKILNIHTGKIIYWEHAGLMDAPDYANDFVWKVNVYANNGLLMGRDVVFSYETETNPLDINVIKKLVETMMK